MTIGDSAFQDPLLQEPDKACDQFSSILAEVLDNELHDKLRQAYTQSRNAGP